MLKVEVIGEMLKWWEGFKAAVPITRSFHPFVDVSLTIIGYSVTEKLEIRHGYLSYTFKGRIFKTDLVTNQLDMDDRGRRIFLKIDSTAPKKIRFQWKIPVPDSIQLSPYGGWDSLPVPYYQIPYGD